MRRQLCNRTVWSRRYNWPIEKYITDTTWENGWIKPIKIKELKQSIELLVPAQPVWLARRVKKTRMQVTIYDRYDRPGIINLWNSKL